MAATRSFFDNFNDNSLDTAKWNASGSITPLEQNRRIEIPLVASSGAVEYGVLVSDATYDLTASHVFVEAVQVPTNLGGNGEMTLELSIDSSNWLRFQFDGSNLIARQNVAGSQSSVSSASYNSTNHRWWRIRESGGTTFWEVSADGQTWNAFTSTANPITVTALMVGIHAGTFASIASPGTAIFDNLNTQIIQPSSIDTRLRLDTPTTNYGTGADMTVTGKALVGNQHVALVNFPLTDIASTDDANTAELDLWTNSTATATFTFEVWHVKTANQDWTEAGATWNTKDGTNAWAGGASGCLVAGTDYEGVGGGTATPLGTATYTANDPAGTRLNFALDLTTVEAAFGSTLHLLITKSGNGSNSAPALRSSENGTTAERPRLTINHSPAGGTITPSNPTVEAYSCHTAHVKATYTFSGTGETSTVATFAYSTNGTDWTNARAVDVVEYDRTSNFAECYIANLPANTLHYFRVTWSGTGIAISGANPRYIGSSTTPGTGTTMLAEIGDPAKLINGSPQYAGARPSFHWTEHTDVVGASNISAGDFTTIAKHDVLFQNPPTNSTRRDYYTDLRATGLVERIWAYRIYEIRTSGGTPVTFSTTPLFDDTARDRWIALAAADETVYLHSAEPVSSGNRLTRVEDGVTKYIPNVSHADVQAEFYQQHKRFEVTYFGTGQADSNHRATDLINDNWWVEHDRLELPVADSPVEYANQAALHAAYDDFTQVLQQSGINVGANILVNNDTVQAEVEAIGASLDLWWFETWWTGFAGSTPVYRTDAQWDICCDIVEAGIALGKMISCNAQIVDTSASYSFTADDLIQQAFIWASWMLCVDLAREMVSFRAFDSSNNGTRRVRVIAEWDLDTGNPTGARTFDTNSGAYTSPSGCWYRTFQNGTVVLNITSTSRDYTVAGGGTLAARTPIWIDAATGAVTPLAWFIYRQGKR